MHLKDMKRKGEGAVVGTQEGYLVGNLSGYRRRRERNRVRERERHKEGRSRRGRERSKGRERERLLKS